MRKVLVIALAAIILPLMYLDESRANTVTASDFNALATTLVGQPTQVLCYSPEDQPDAAGYTYVGETYTIWLAGDICGSLRNTIRNPKRYLRSWDNREAAGEAVLVLTHEAMHLRLQSDDEGIVECTAFRNVAQTIHLLPLTWQQRRGMYQSARRSHYSKPTTGINATYRSVC